MLTLAAISTLAVLVERLTEYFAQPLFEAQKWNKLGLRYVALALGVAAALIFKAALFSTLGLEAFHPIADQVITGIVLGGGASLLHEFLPAQ